MLIFSLSTRWQTNKICEKLGSMETLQRLFSCEGKHYTSNWRNIHCSLTLALEFVYATPFSRSILFLTSFLQLVKTAELNPSKNYIMGCHPHGIMSVGAFSCFSTDRNGFAETFPGIRPTLAILAGLFRLPLLREYILSAGQYNEC